MDLDEATILLDEIDEHGRNLTDAEIDLLDELLKQTDRGEPPTPLQAEIIQRMHASRVW